MHFRAYLVAVLICLLRQGDALAAEPTRVNVNLTPETVEVEPVKQRVNRVLTFISRHAQAPQQSPVLTQPPKAGSVDARSKGRLDPGFDYGNFLKERSFGERMNANTIAVISGTPGSTDFHMGSNLAFALDDGENLRICRSSVKVLVKMLNDVRFLRGDDIRFVRTDSGRNSNG